MSTELAGNGVDSVVNELSSSSPSPSKSKAGSIIDPDNSQSPHQLSNKTSDNNSSSSGPGTSAYSTPRSSSEKLDVSEVTLRYQEQLVTQCKTRMKDKFDSLEKETGVKLRRYWSENINDSRSDLDHGTDEDDEDSSENESHVEQKEKSNPDRTSTSTIDTIVKPPTFESQVSDIPSLNEVKPIDSVTNDTIQLLRKQLEKVQDELKAKDDEITKLSRIRSQVEYELEDLTASLFEEANKMVRTANVNKAKFERDYKEAMMKMHVLQAEVDALKVLVITSTPATPNKHLHPHIEGPKNNLKGELMSWRSRLSPFNHLPRIITKSHSNQTTPKKSPSNYELGGTPGLNYESNGLTCDLETEAPGSSLMGEVDPVFHQQFAEWRKNPSIDKSSSFINNIYEQEVYPVLNFKNRSLTESVLSAIEDGSIAIESVSDKTAFPKKCALLDIPRTCKYRMKLGKDWYNISLLCRNRIAAICDLFCYLRYIQQGLVKSSFHDVYWEIMQRRKNIALSRLGLPTC